MNIPIINLRIKWISFAKQWFIVIEKLLANYMTNYFTDTYHPQTCPIFPNWNKIKIFKYSVIIWATGFVSTTWASMKVTVKVENMFLGCFCFLLFLFCLVSIFQLLLVPKYTRGYAPSCFVFCTKMSYCQFPQWFETSVLFGFCPWNIYPCHGNVCMSQGPSTLTAIKTNTD